MVTLTKTNLRQNKNTNNIFSILRAHVSIHLRLTILLLVWQIHLFGTHGFTFTFSSSSGSNAGRIQRQQAAIMVCSASASAPAPVPVEQIREAMQLTTRGQTNITAAYLAEQSWSTFITQKEFSTQQSPSIVALCNSLYASTLSRIGRDKDALMVHDQTLALVKDMSSMNDDNLNLLIDLRISRGEALQRLMNYEEAGSEFLAVCQLHELHHQQQQQQQQQNQDRPLPVLGKIAKSAYSSALCALRQNDLKAAESILSSCLRLDKISLNFNFNLNTEDSNAGADMVHVVDANLVGFYGAILWELQSGSNSASKSKSKSASKYTPLQLLQYAASSPIASPVYRWFHAIASTSISTSTSTSNSNSIQISNCDLFKGGLSHMDKGSLLQIASINQSPFDDPTLLHLDDKVYLHDLLEANANGNIMTTLTSTSTSTSASSSKHWPNGYVLPRDKEDFEICSAANTSSHWILKERAGYGSHGNQIVKKAEEITIGGGANSKDPKNFVLCQHLIEPSMLYQGRKFSIRVYVVYFKNRSTTTSTSASMNTCDNCGENDHGSVYLLEEGLAKLAESDYEISNPNEDMFMTNSGRIEGDGMIQYNFGTLKAYIEEQYGVGAFDKVWDSVEESVTFVMQRHHLRFYSNVRDSYNNDESDGYTDSNSTSLFSTVPKIMGFDFIIDTSLQPWLMEVNRFPGLEARGSVDTLVKNQVIETAWKLASERTQMDCGLISRDDTTRSTCSEACECAVKKLRI